ncbi:MAG TPA: DUF6272 family protein [Bacteroidales bacterium]|nr:DUF6272 family protein [Bacteroidales bacterium]
MMKDSKYEILKIDFTSNSDYDLFFDIITNKINSIEDIEKSYRKKIIICAVELIQNNIIHNCKANSRVEISKTNDFIILDYIQSTDKQKYENLIKKIDLVNKMNFENISLKIKENIENSKSNLGSGNGLLTCRLKTKNFVNIKLIETNSENEYKFIIRLKFDCYESTNPSSGKNTIG